MLIYASSLNLKQNIVSITLKGNLQRSVLFNQENLAPCVSILNLFLENFIQYIFYYKLLYSRKFFQIVPLLTYQISYFSILR